MEWGPVIAAYFTGLIGVLAWLVKGWFGRIERRMDIIDQYQVDAERRFATWEVLRELDCKVDDHEGRISAMEAKGSRG